MSTNRAAMIAAFGDFLDSLDSGEATTTTKEAPVKGSRTTTSKTRKAPVFAAGKTLTCEDCGKRTNRKAANQKRCPKCRAARDEANNLAWASSADERKAKREAAEARRPANQALSAWLRDEVGVQPREQVWKAAQAGERNKATLRKIAAEHGLVVKAAPAKQVAAKVEVEKPAKRTKAEINAEVAKLVGTGYFTRAEAREIVLTNA
jgi:hypothetical protein